MRSWRWRATSAPGSVAERIDLLHTHSYKPNLYARLAGLPCRESGLKIAAHYHNQYDNKWEKDGSLTLERMLARSSDALLAVSGSVRDHVAERIGVPAERVDVILNGVDAARFAGQDAAAARNRFGLPPARPVVGIVGRISQQKGQEELLERLASPLVGRTLEIVDRVLAEAGTTPDRIDQVLLVGGQARMPLGQERLTRLSGKPPGKGVHPDEAVAVGAALYGWSLRAPSTEQLQLLDVIPMAIGLEQAGGLMHVVFPRNAPIPNARAVAATNSAEGQTELVVRIYQGDQARTERNDLLGEFTFSGVRPSAPGEVRLEIQFEVSVDGILSMSARDVDSGRLMQTTVRVAEG